LLKFEKFARKLHERKHVVVAVIVPNVPNVPNVASIASHIAAAEQ
jgi:hypothetical protein